MQERLPGKDGILPGCGVLSDNTWDRVISKAVSLPTTNAIKSFQEEFSGPSPVQFLAFGDPTDLICLWSLWLLYQKLADGGFLLKEEEAQKTKKDLALSEGKAQIPDT